MTAAQSVKSFVRDLLGKPAELAELRDVMAALPPPPSRPVMDDAERVALGKVLAEDYEATMVAGSTTYERARIQAAARLHEAQRALEQLVEERAATVAGYTARRDPRLQRLWAERLPEVDELLSALEEEARELRVEHFELPPDERRINLLGNPANPRVVGEIVPMDRGGPTMFEGRSATNAQSVEARRRGLRALGESIRVATERGAYGSVQELLTLHARGYRELPAVETVAQLAARVRKAVSDPVTSLRPPGQYRSQGTRA